MGVGVGLGNSTCSTLKLFKAIAKPCHVENQESLRRGVFLAQADYRQTLFVAFGAPDA